VIPGLTTDTSLLLTLSGEIELDDERQTAPVAGELALLITARFQGGAEIELRWLKLYSFRPDGSRDRERGIYLLGLMGSGKLTESPRESSISVGIEARVYQVSPEQAGANLEVGMRELPGLAIFKGRLEGILTAGSEARMAFLRSQLVLSEGELLTGVRGLALQFTPVPVTVLAAEVTVDRRGMRTLAPAPVTQGLWLQPVQFGADPKQHLEATGRFWKSQHDNAVTIWGKCCIRIMAKDCYTCVDNALRSSTDPDALLACLPADLQKPNVIPVFMLDLDLTNDSGGHTYPAGTGADVILLSAESKGNPAMLAHEIGHALNGEHPARDNRPCVKHKGKWQADPCTVLRPSGSASRPCTTLNSDCNCYNAVSVLQGSLLADSCVAQPDALPIDGCNDEPKGVGVLQALKRALEKLLGR
jgi:hypothetical protein